MLGGFIVIAVWGTGILLFAECSRILARRARKLQALTPPVPALPLDEDERDALEDISFYMSLDTAADPWDGKPVTVRGRRRARRPSCP